jgi:hypothetical protein
MPDDDKAPKKESHKKKQVTRKAMQESLSIESQHYLPIGRVSEQLVWHEFSENQAQYHPSLATKVFPV